LLLSVRPSVCPSVACIANNSRTQRPSVPKFGSKVPTLDATRSPVSRSNGQRSGLEASGGIPCRPNPAATLLVIRGILNVSYNKPVPQKNPRLYDSHSCRWLRLGVWTREHPRPAPPRLLRYHIFRYNLHMHIEVVIPKKDC